MTIMIVPADSGNLNFTTADGRAISNEYKAVNIYSFNTVQISTDIQSQLPCLIFKSIGGINDIVWLMPNAAAADQEYATILTYTTT